VRLALTVGAGLLIGYNRSEHGKAVGMRTTVLVCLAASVAMIQVNLLLPMAGRPPNSFVMNDLMRLPLGILTGVGFIGGGAILRRENIVIGVTTAATLWLVTVIGLCLGGGQIALGLAATILGLLALWPLQWIESALPQERRAQLTIEFDSSDIGETEIRRRIRAAGLSIIGGAAQSESLGTRRKIVVELRRMRRQRDTEPPALIHELMQVEGILSLRWKE
jgi:putative Mg2+ transporter-C (MgtC) family protein